MCLFSLLEEEQKWSEGDRVRFALIFDQYPSGTAHHRLLLVDRLAREFPHKTRAEMVRGVG